jgi:hypothetical protein
VLYNTDGSQGAARPASVPESDPQEAFTGLEPVRTVKATRS